MHRQVQLPHEALARSRGGAHSARVASSSPPRRDADSARMPLFGSPPPPPPEFSYAQCYADFLTNALGEPSVLRAFLLTVGVATFVALPLIAILNADKVVKPDKPIIHKHPLFNPNVQRDLNFPTYAQCSAFFFAVYLIAVGTAINVAPVRTHASSRARSSAASCRRSRAAGRRLRHLRRLLRRPLLHRLGVAQFAPDLLDDRVRAAALPAGDPRRRRPRGAHAGRVPRGLHPDRRHHRAAHAVVAAKDKTTYEYPSWKTHH